MTPTPKEKAQELVEKYYILSMDSFRTLIYAKQCALIAVQEIINSRSDDKGFDDTMFANNEYHTPHPMYLSYWQEVENELNKSEYDDTDTERKSRRISR